MHEAGLGSGEICFVYDNYFGYPEIGSGMGFELMEGARKRGRPATGRGAQVQVRLQPMLLKQIDLWRGNKSDAPSRPEAIRRLVQLGLAAHPARRAQPLIHSPDDPD
jgi:hypothetical protein